MGMQLGGDVGRNGAREDVLKVQTLLANLGERPGHGFWHGGLTGMGSEALAQAISAFQRHVGLAKQASGQMAHSTEREVDGTIRPNSRTWRALLDGAPGWADEFRVLPNTQPPVVYWTKDYRSMQNRTVPELEHMRSLIEPTEFSQLVRVVFRFASELAVVPSVAAHGITREGRIFVRIELPNLHVADQRDAKMRPIDSNAGAIPPGLWSHMEQAMQTAGWLSTAGHHGTGGGRFQVGQPLFQGMDLEAGRKLFARFKIKASDYNVAESVLAAAIALIAKLPNTDPAAKTTLDRLISYAGQSDHRARETLEQRRHAMSRALSAEWVEYQDSDALIAIIEEYGLFERFAIIAGLVVHGISFAWAVKSSAAVASTLSAKVLSVAARSSIPLAILGFFYSSLERRFAADLLAEFQRRLGNLDGSTASVAGIEIPNGHTRETFLLDLFQIEALRVSEQDKPGLFALMEHILLIRESEQIGINFDIRHRINRVLLVDPRAAERLNYVFRRTIDPVGRHNLKYQPTAELQALFFKTRAASIVADQVDKIGMIVGLSKGDILQVALLLLEKHSEQVKNLAQKEIIRRIIESTPMGHSSKNYEYQ